MQFRRKQCQGCAFREGSPEHADPEWWNEILLHCLHGVFICHKTCLQLEGDEWRGKFDRTRKPDGSPATIDDHQLCAGFVKMFGEEIGINTKQVK